MQRRTPSLRAGSVPAAGAAFVLLAALLVVVGPRAGAGPDVPGLTRSDATPAAYTARKPPLRWLQIERTKRGYRVTAGLQHSRMRISETRRGLRIVDSGTAELRERLRSCERIRVDRGIGAVCRVPDGVSKRRPMKLGVVPRLGHDLVDAHTLSARFDLSVLADKGRDVVRLGAGDDFVNGYTGADRVYGGAGRDWLRTGRDDDLLKGGAGADRLVGVEGSDVLRGGDGRDLLSCGPGRDHAWTERGDTRKSCERLHR